MKQNMDLLAKQQIYRTGIGKKWEKTESLIENQLTMLSAAMSDVQDISFTPQPNDACIEVPLNRAFHLIEDFWLVGKQLRRKLEELRDGKPRYVPYLLERLEINNRMGKEHLKRFEAYFM